MGFEVGDMVRAIPGKVKEKYVRENGEGRIGEVVQVRTGMGDEVFYAVRMGFYFAHRAIPVLFAESEIELFRKAKPPKSPEEAVAYLQKENDRLRQKIKDIKKVVVRNTGLGSVLRDSLDTDPESTMGEQAAEEIAELLGAFDDV